MRHEKLNGRRQQLLSKAFMHDKTSREKTSRSMRLSAPRGDAHYSRTHPEKVKRGEKHPIAKLTEAKVLQIFRLREELTQRQIAKIVGVQQTTVGRVLRRESWAHVQALTL
jgi:DNA invertase Pin-like site-specific DNA recombinase